MQILGFDYPDGLHYWLERDMWARQQEDGLIQVGVSAFGVHISGAFFMCRPKPVGTVLEQGQTIAIVELNKSVVTVKTPVSGTVREINPLLEETPELIEKEPYGRGWLVKIAPSRWAQDLQQLLGGDRLPDAASVRMQLENMDFSRGGA